MFLNASEIKLMLHPSENTYRTQFAREAIKLLIATIATEVPVMKQIENESIEKR